METTWAFGDRPFLLIGERTFSYGEFFAASCALAVRLVGGEFGLRAGDRVCIAMSDRIEWQVAFWGVQLAGLVAVPVDTSWGEGEFTSVLDDCDPRLLFVDRVRLPRVAAWAEAAAARVVLLEGEVEGADPAVAPPGLDVRPEDCSTIFYTGEGRSGRPPLGAVATHLAQAGAVMNARFHAAVSDLGRGRGRIPGFGPVPVTTLTYPFFHPASFADVYRAMAVGGTLLVEEGERAGAEGVPRVRVDGRLAETCGAVLLDGRPTPVTEVRVTGPRGEPLPDGEVGELWLRGQSLARGYWGDPVAGLAAFPEGGGGWFLTGVRATVREGHVSGAMGAMGAGGE
ncbi:AMP-binding protein [Streptomyces sp. NPDC087420]|uniref:AMP-binding protein n=1 Tax=Streptomyces sp. NPDC087420 TaxID=3365785 RepID=UPI003834F4D8